MSNFWRRGACFAILSLAASACSAGESAPKAQMMQVEPLAIAASDPNLQWGDCPPIFPAGCQIAVLQGDPAQPNADVLLRVPGGYEIPAHTHTSAERMVLISGAFEVRYQGAEPAVLAAGHYAYGPAGAPHSAACQGTEACTLFIAFEGPVDAHAFEGVID